MLEQAFAALSPQLADRYVALLDRELSGSAELSDLHGIYLDYAVRDRHLPRPILAYFGYHATSDAVDFADLPQIGDGVLIAQLLRDVLAIHDDIVDEDLDKFGAQPLPVALSAVAGSERALTKRGKDLALYYGDFLVGVMLHVAGSLRPEGAALRIIRLIGDTLYVTQRGQLSELLLEDRPIAATTVDHLLLVGERKAAYYCYSFPFALGAFHAGHPDEIVDPVTRLLVRVGTASQVIDDITGAFPGVIDQEKNALGEIANLRRTVPLVLFAGEPKSNQIEALLTAPVPLDESAAQQLREALWSSSVPSRALEICDRLIDSLTSELDVLPLGAATSEYLRDLVEHRLVGSLDRLRAAL